MDNLTTSPRVMSDDRPHLSFLAVEKTTKGVNPRSKIGAESGLECHTRRKVFFFLRRSVLSKSVLLLRRAQYKESVAGL